MNPFLVADCVGKTYGDRRVLSSATLRAVPGEVRVLLGRSGEGKSTLMRIAAGWLAPDSGVVRCDGETPLALTADGMARRGVFYLPDHGALSTALTVRAQLDMLAERYPGGARPEDAAAQLGIAHGLDERPSTLSGGEGRRADLAAVLVRAPRCLLADEPLRGIAPIDAEALMGSFRAMSRAGIAVVVTGHDVELLLDGADHVTWVTSGTTYELGPPQFAREQEQFREQYLGRRAR